MSNLCYSKLLKNSDKNFVFSPKFSHFFPFSTTTNQNPSPKNSFVVDYLINPCGFSREKAVVALTDLTHINCPQNPDHVLKFPKQCDFDDSHIRKLLIWRPRSVSAITANTQQSKLIFNPDCIRNGYQNSIFPSQVRHFCQFSTTATENPSSQNHFMVSYLINKCGFSREEAITVSKDLIRIKCSKKADSVIKFLKQLGFNDTNTRKLIAWRPRLLSANVERTLEPKIKALQELGLSGTGIVDLIVSNPNILFRSVNKQLLPSVEFLRTLLLTDEKVIKALKKSTWFLTCDIQKRLAPNISLLGKFGVSNGTISKILLRYPGFLLQKASWLEEIVNRVSQLGLPHSSGMFIHAIHAVGSMSKSTLDAKFEILKSLGWSETDIISAFQRAPDYIRCSESKFRQGMDFFLNELKFEPCYIALYPRLFSYNLEKRIIPRINVLEILKSKDLLNRHMSLYTLVSLSEKKFLDYYVLPHKNKAPDVWDAYMGSVRGV